MKHPKIDLKTMLGTALPVCTMHRASKAGNIRFRLFFFHLSNKLFLSRHCSYIVLNFSVFLKVIELFLPNNAVIYSENGSFFVFYKDKLVWDYLVWKKKAKQQKNKQTKSITNEKKGKQKQKRTMYTIVYHRWALSSNY